ncbi:MAG TPA: hypothetical protein PKM88_00590 [bacterium]|nr:hypothetical protein [bacterium]
MYKTIAILTAILFISAANAEEISVQWQQITQIEEKLGYWHHELAVIRAQLEETNRSIAALKDGGVNIIEEIRLNSLLRESQERAKRMADIEFTIRTLADTRMTLVNRSLEGVKRELALRAERLKAQQAAGEQEAFSQTLKELVALDNLKGALESRRELNIVRNPVNLQVADWNSPTEVREKAGILRDEIQSVERELALTQTRISSNLAEIRQKEEIVRFVRDLQGLQSARALVIDPATIPHLEQAAARLRETVGQLRQYQGTLTVELAKLREQTDRMTAYADRMERELLR